MLLFDSYANMLKLDKEGAYESIEIERIDPFQAELENLVAAIHGTGELEVSPAWGRHIVHVLNACEESSQSGREVVL
jgi:hypothetical protein